jgi:hypothetical protein
MDTGAAATLRAMLRAALRAVLAALIAATLVAVLALLAARLVSLGLRQRGAAARGQHQRQSRCRHIPHRSAPLWGAERARLHCLQPGTSRIQHELALNRINSSGSASVPPPTC